MIFTSNRLHILFFVAAYVDWNRLEVSHLAVLAR